MLKQTFFWTMAELFDFVVKEKLKSFSVFEGSIGYNLTYQMEEN